MRQPLAAGSRPVCSPRAERPDARTRPGYNAGVDIFRLIAERKIEEAIQNGELDDLPLRGQPIPDDTLGIPEEERVAFRLMKNAGVLPEELQLSQEIVRLRATLAGVVESDEERTRLVRRLATCEAQRSFLLERRRLRRVL